MPATRNTKSKASSNKKGSAPNRRRSLSDSERPSSVPIQRVSPPQGLSLTDLVQADETRSLSVREIPPINVVGAGRKKINVDLAFDSSDDESFTSVLQHVPYDGNVTVHPLQAQHRPSTSALGPRPPSDLRLAVSNQKAGCGSWFTFDPIVLGGARLEKIFTLSNFLCQFRQILFALAPAHIPLVMLNGSEALILSETGAYFGRLPEVLAGVSKLGGHTLRTFLKEGENILQKWRMLKAALRYKSGDKFLLEETNFLIKQSLNVLRDFLDTYNQNATALGSIQQLIIWCKDEVFRALIGGKNSDQLVASLAGLRSHSKTLALSSFSTICNWKNKKTYNSSGSKSSSSGRSKRRFDSDDKKGSDKKPKFFS